MRDLIMKIVKFSIQKCDATNQFVDIIPNFKGAHSQGDSIELLLFNLKEVCVMLEIKDIQLSSKINSTSYKIQL